MLKNFTPVVIACYGKDKELKFRLLRDKNARFEAFRQRKSRFFQFPVLVLSTKEDKRTHITVR